MAQMVGPPAGPVYGAVSLPTQLAWNPAKYGAQAMAAEAGSPAGGAPAGARMGALAPIIVLALVAWLLAEHDLRLRAGGSGAFGLK